jgi:hypothetical protein
MLTARPASYKVAPAASRAFIVSRFQPWQQFSVETRTDQASLRRLTHIRSEKNELPELYCRLSNTTADFFKESIMQVTQLVDVSWEKFKRDTTQPVPLLPARADPQALFLSLPNSGSYLHSVLRLPRSMKRTSPSLQLPLLYDTTIEQVEQFIDTYHREEPQLTGNLSPELSCKKLSDAILGLMNSVGTAYDFDPKQISMFISESF